MFEHFMSMLNRALTRVEPTYYVLNNNTSERAFCLELYHQLKLIMADESKDIPANIMFTGEITKLQRQAILPAIGLPGFQGNINHLMPDFLWHDPLRGDNQILAMEVKTRRNLNSKQMIKDIAKLGLLMDGLNYEYGIFLAANRTMQQIERLLEPIRQGDAFVYTYTRNKVEQEEEPRNFRPDRIKIITSIHNREPEQCWLNELL